VRVPQPKETREHEERNRKRNGYGDWQPSIALEEQEAGDDNEYCQCLSPDEDGSAGSEERPGCARKPDRSCRP
jgi:hypothetical protein